MNRRHFSAALDVLGLASAAGAQSKPDVEHLQLSQNGWMPNNDRLPVLLYRHVFQPESTDTADRMEAAFTRNQWPPQWRNGVYPFHHYHSTAHEVLGFAGGSARLILGGEGGHVVPVSAGDVLVLPTGTGHCLQSADAGFLVIGACPLDQHWDICRTAPGPEAFQRMRGLRFPASDPVSGPTGPLVAAWHS